MSNIFYGDTVYYNDIKCTVISTAWSNNITIWNADPDGSPFDENGPIEYKVSDGNESYTCNRSQLFTLTEWRNNRLDKLNN